VRLEEDPAPPPAGKTGLEALLIEQGSVNEHQIERARRIAAKLRQPKPILDILVETGQLARSERDRITRLYRSHLEIAEILQEEGALSEQGYALYLQARGRSPALSDRRILVDGGYVSEEQFLRAVAAKHDFAYLEPEAALVQDKLLSKVSLPYLSRNKALPYRLVDDVLTVVMNDPLKAEVVRELERIYGVRVRPACATGPAIQAALERAYDQVRGIAPENEGVVALKYREIEDVEETEEIGVEAVRIVDHIFFRAIGMGASDVHIEPREKEIKVRVRVDGVLQPLLEIPADFAPRIASRVKVLCGADLAERRLHQDGRIFVKAGGKEVDMRVSTYASLYGETLVIRLLDRTRGLIPLDALGFEPAVRGLLKEVVLRASSGLVLVTGPTGAGKTSTMYSFVDSMLDDTLKVITCEDPVEYVLAGTTQCSVNQKTGPTFVDSLRAMVRQDPDVIVVGEIRDRATAELAVEAALTGHKVLSSFHTEDSVSAVLRLLEMGVEPFLVASTLACVVAQRLVRHVCPECRRKGSASRHDLRYLGLSREQLGSVFLVEGAGCEACLGTGYKGRLGIHEVLVLDDDFRDGILARTPSRELRAMAKRLPGFMTLEESGLLKVVGGATTLAELADNVPRDSEARSMAELGEIAAKRNL